MQINWIEGFEIAVKTTEKETVISANREGLLSLAAVLKTLAEGAPGDHIHLDEFNSLDAGSAELIIEKTDG